MSIVFQPNCAAIGVCIRAAKEVEMPLRLRQVREHVVLLRLPAYDRNRSRCVSSLKKKSSAGRGRIHRLLLGLPIAGG
ncbi:hypothetical protein TAL182_PB00241 (plasmid) [Rhizobium sp. TAL182]|nr:hypothetical protein TAL182_PB00241 [Rhizobium sp. TAL182]